MTLYPVFRDRFYIGKKPQILITDLDMLKQIMVKDFDNFPDHSVRYVVCIHPTRIINKAYLWVARGLLPILTLIS